MIIRKKFFIVIFLLTFHSYCTTPLAEQFKQNGYVELCDEHNGSATFNTLYLLFDECIEFLQKNPTWKQKLYAAKERFIRSKEKNIYSTDFFGLYDESEQKGRRQISFYYSTHFHTFICSRYPEFSKIPQLAQFFKACNEIQKPYGHVFKQAATELHLATLFSSHADSPPLLLKIVKYLPSYRPTKPHYDGTAFSLLLDSTDNQALRLSRYKTLCTTDDFTPATRKFSRSEKHNSILLIPGTFLAEFSIYPTPHVIVQSDAIRHATVAFAMRPDYTNSYKQEFAQLPCFKNLE